MFPRGIPGEALLLKIRPEAVYIDFEIDLHVDEREVTDDGDKERLL